MPKFKVTMILKDDGDIDVFISDATKEMPYTESVLAMFEAGDLSEACGWVKRTIKKLDK